MGQYCKYQKSATAALLLGLLLLVGEFDLFLLFLIVYLLVGVVVKVTTG